MKSNGYEERKSGTISFWLSKDDISYLAEVAEELDVPRNRALSMIIDNHRQLRAKRLARKA